MRLFVGTTLLITGLDEVRCGYESEGWLNVGVLHGVTILGFQQMLLEP